MIATVAALFYWPCLTEFVRAWIRGYNICRQVKASNQTDGRAPIIAVNPVLLGGMYQN
jgi:hypothetical protein